mgnify:CR=1 FL=1
MKLELSNGSYLTLDDKYTEDEALQLWKMAEDDIKSEQLDNTQEQPVKPIEPTPQDPTGDLTQFNAPVEQPSQATIAQMQAEANPKDTSDFSRGFKTSYEQLPELGYGLEAGAYAIGESAFGEGGMLTQGKQEAVAKMIEAQKETQANAKESDSFTFAYEKAKQGDFNALADTVQYGLGYGLGQMSQAVITGGLGSTVAKTAAETFAKEYTAKLVEQEALKVAEQTAARELTQEQIQQQAVKNVAESIANKGRDYALGAQAVGLEGGEILGDLAKQSTEQNRSLTAGEVIKGLGATALAAAGEFYADRFGLDILGGKRLSEAGKYTEGLKGNLLRGAATGVKGGAVEGGTEFAQTLIEEAGKGKDPFSSESLRQAIDATALGFIGGGAIGTVGGALSPAQQRPDRPATGEIDPSMLSGGLPNSTAQTTAQQPAQTSSKWQDTMGKIRGIVGENQLVDNETVAKDVMGAETIEDAIAAANHATDAIAFDYDMNMEQAATLAQDLTKTDTDYLDNKDYQDAVQLENQLSTVRDQLAYNKFQTAFEESNQQASRSEFNALVEQEISNKNQQLKDLIQYQSDERARKVEVEASIPSINKALEDAQWAKTRNNRNAVIQMVFDRNVPAENIFSAIKAELKRQGFKDTEINQDDIDSYNLLKAYDQNNFTIAKEPVSFGGQPVAARSASDIEFYNTGTNKVDKRGNIIADALGEQGVNAGEQFTGEQGQDVVTNFVSPETPVRQESDALRKVDEWVSNGATYKNGMLINSKGKKFVLNTVQREYYLNNRPFQITQSPVTLTEQGYSETQQGQDTITGAPSFNTRVLKEVLDIQIKERVDSNKENRNLSSVNQRIEEQQWIKTRNNRNAAIQTVFDKNVAASNIEPAIKAELKRQGFKDTELSEDDINAYELLQSAYARREPEIANAPVDIGVQQPVSSKRVRLVRQGVNAGEQVAEGQQGQDVVTNFVEPSTPVRQDSDALRKVDEWLRAGAIYKNGMLIDSKGKKFLLNKAQREYYLENRATPIAKAPVDMGEVGNAPEILSTYTQQEVTQREEAQKAAEKEQAVKDAAAERKRQADNQVDSVVDEMLGRGMTTTKDIFAPERKPKFSKTKAQERLAPNGRPSNLNATQYEQVRTPEFKAWFGDWENDPENASKVVDENGEPLVVYHGTKQIDIESFENVRNPKDWGDVFKQYKEEGGIPYALYRYGFFFSPVKEIANNYTGDNTGALYPVFISSNNPIFVDYSKVKNKLPPYAPLGEKNTNGLIYHNNDFDKVLEIAVIDPNQIKSATGNTGEFSKESNDIRFSKAAKKVLDDNPLAIVHNLKLKNLVHADKMGGLPAPSIAVVNQKYPLSGFGEITLIGDTSQFAPEADKANRFYNADVYSPRYPEITYIVDSKAVSNANEALSDDAKVLANAMGRSGLIDKSSIEDRGLVDGLANNSVLQYEFLKTIGKAPKMQYKPNKVPPANMKKFVASKVPAMELKNDPNFVQAVTDTYNESVRKRNETLKQNKPYFEASSQQALNLASDYQYMIEEFRNQKGAQKSIDTYATSKLIREKTNQAQYEKWLVENYSNLITDERIFNGFTNAGNRIYLPHNLDTVVKLMTKTVKGGENVSYGIGTIRAHTAKQFKTVKAIQAARGEIVTAEKLEAVKEELSNEFESLSEELRPYSDYSNPSATDALSDLVSKGTRAFKESYQDVPAETMTKVYDFLDKLKNMPAHYFEAKIGRAVKLNEFAGALVPKGKEYDEAVKILNANGVTKIKRYTENDSQSRSDALLNFSELLFSQTQEPTVNNHTEQSLKEGLTQAGDNAYGKGWTNRLLATGMFEFISDADAQAIVEEAAGVSYSKAKAQERLAPNGKPSNLNAIIDRLHIDKGIFENSIEYHSAHKDVKGISSDMSITKDVEQLMKKRFLTEVESTVGIKDGIATLYRAIALDSIDDIDTTNLGIYWARSEKESVVIDDEGYNHNGKNRGKDKYVIKADVSINDIDWQSTFDIYVMNNWMEGEIRVSKGQPPINVSFKREGHKEKWNNLPSSKNIDIRFSKNGDIEAFFNPAEGKTYFVSENISKDKDLHYLMMHEVSVHMLNMGENKTEFEKFLKATDNLVKVKNFAALKGRQDALDADTPQEDLREETLAYLVKYVPKLKVVQQFKAWLKNALRNMSKSFPAAQRLGFIQWANKLSDQDLLYIANATLRKAPEMLGSSKREANSFIAKASKALSAEQMRALGQLDLLEFIQEIADMPRENSRIGMTHEQILDRIPELNESANNMMAILYDNNMLQISTKGNLIKGVSTNDIENFAKSNPEFRKLAELHDALVEEYKPVEPYKTLPTPATKFEMQEALAANKVSKINQLIPNGYKVKLRLDIPAYVRGKTWVVTAHEGNSEKNSIFGVKEDTAIGYYGYAVADNPQFSVEEFGSLKIAAKTVNKYPLATVDGEYVNMSAQEAKRLADEALDNPNWIQVGMDPERHSYFYDRKTMQPVLSGSRVIQIGSILMVENPVFGDKKSFLFSKKAKEGEIVNRSTGYTAYDTAKPIPEEVDNKANYPEGVSLEEERDWLMQQLRRFDSFRKLNDKSNELINKYLTTMGRLPELGNYLGMRYQTLGKIDNVDDIVRNVFDTLQKATKEDSKEIYTYLTDNKATTEFIIDPQMALMAKDLKEAITIIGKKLVEFNIIPMESFQMYEGRYLPRVYLEHIIQSSDRYQSLGSGKTLSPMGYAKKRDNNLPEEFRRLIKGEIKNTAYLASRTLSIPLRDIAMMEFFNQISDNEKWVWKQSLINIELDAKTNRPTAIFDDDGVINYNATNSALEGKPKKSIVRKVTPYFLDKEADRILDQSYSAPEEDRKDMQDLAKMMKRAASQAMVNMDAVPADFMKMPNIAKYGSLRGLVVHKLIYDDLVGTINTYGAAGEQTALENFFGNNGILAKITNAFKFSHVAINIPTQVTNLLSNGLLLHMSGVRFDKVPVRVTQAFKEVLNEGENYKKMIAMGGRKATFSNQELSGITEWLLENEAEFSDKNTDWFSIVHIMRELSYLTGKTVRGANNLHQNIEMVFKVAKFIDMKAKGANDETAAVMAHQALFDYSFIPRWAKWLRTVPMGIPFITWTIKSFEATLRTAANRPTTFLPYYMLGYAMSLAAAADFGDDGEDKLKAILKLLPERMQRGGSVWILPIRDDAGRTQLIDMKNLFPWGKTAEAIDSLSKLVGNQDVAELRTLADSVGVFSSPITQAVVAIDTNKDAFTGKQIVDENDPPAAKLQSILEYTYGMMSPPMLGGKGDIATLIKSQFPSQYEGIMNKDGSPKKTEQQAFIHLFTGLSIKSVDSEFDRHKKIEAFNSMITGIKAQRTRELRSNPNLSEESRRIVREKYDARIERVKEKKQKFKDETDILK